jgi:hypothetical protein
MKPTSSLLALLVIASAAAGQVAITVGPSPAPVGCPVAISVANDTNLAITLANPCPYQVRNAGGQVIFSPFCIQIIVNVNPGAVFTAYWPQTDNNGLQVAPGTYTVDVFLPGGMASATVTIDNLVPAGLGQLGPARIGTTRHFYLCSPQDGGFAYLMGASGLPVSGGIPTCGGVVPLEPDAILMLSLGPNPFFSGFSGALPNSGSSTVPTVSVPFDPAIVGATFAAAYVVLDPAAPCVVRTVSALLLVQIV